MCYVGQGKASLTNKDIGHRRNPEIKVLNVLGEYGGFSILILVCFMIFFLKQAYDTQFKRYKG